MAGAAKFATQEMKDKVIELTQTVDSTPGPEGYYTDMVNGGLIPAELPCEAYALWDSQGYLQAAQSTDKMNGWYFHCFATELPYWSEASYEAQDPQGNSITVNEGSLMAEFIAGTKNYFYINGERFTLAGPKEGPEEAYAFPVTCTGTLGRGAIATFDKAGTGVSVHIFSTSPAVRTEVRLGCDQVGPNFPNAAVDARGELPDKVAKHTSSTETSPFYYTVG